MARSEEIVLSSDASGQMWNCCIWEPHSDSSLIHYKGSASKPRSLCSLSQQYIISADIQKPLLNMWEIQRKEQHQSRMVCPGHVSSLAVSPDSVYCVAGIEEKIYVWQVSTGNLLAVLRRHFQRVTNICFTDDGCFFLTGGEDNLIMVWDLASVLQTEHTQSSEPIHIWSQHALPITDLHCGKGGISCRVVSSSQDQTCKLWDIPSGQMLYSFIFDTPILSVAMDMAEQRLCAGGLDGNIYSVNLSEKLPGKQKVVSSEQQTGNVYKGHSKAVTCLSVSMDGSLLLSGSEDHKACIWHVNSRQCIRRLLHKVIDGLVVWGIEQLASGSTVSLARLLCSNDEHCYLLSQLSGAVTNAMFIPTPSCLQTETGRPTLPIKPFQRHLYVPPSSRVNTEAEESASIEGAPVNMCHPLKITQEVSWAGDLQSSILSEKKSSTMTADSERDELANLRQENSHLRKLAANSILMSI